MESNPWQVKSIQAFNCFKCPECMFFSQEELDFKAHAMKNHPMSNAFFTGKSFSEALILESVNPQFDERLFIVSPEKFGTILSHCGLTHVRMRASEKDLPICSLKFLVHKEKFVKMLRLIKQKVLT